MKTYQMFAAIFAVTLAAASVSATDPVITTTGGFYGGYGDGYGYSYHSSTLEEGILRGSGALLQGAGQYNYDTSRAAINQQEALSRAYDNRLKGIQTYFEAKAINESYVARHQKPRLTQQELTQLAKESAPARLTSYQYEPAFGKVFWPALLEAPQFAAHRAAIEELMASRDPLNSGVGSANHRDVRQVTLAMQEILKADIATANPQEYVAAKKFLASLEYEAQQRAGASGVASR